MNYVSPEQIAKAREMDLLTYLRLYEPQELVHFGGNTYCTREHDSLKISNGKWYWFSRGIGGASALDYLVKVKDVPFVQAVEQLSGQATMVPSATKAKAEIKKPKVLLLPQASRCTTHAVSYLASRGIDYEIISYCIQTGRLYESYPHHNVVLLGWTVSTSPGMPISGVSTLTSKEKPTAATSGFLSVSQHRAAIRFTCSKVPSIFCPMPPCSIWPVRTGGRIICFLWRVYSERLGKQPAPGSQKVSG